MWLIHFAHNPKLQLGVCLKERLPTARNLTERRIAYAIRFGTPLLGYDASMTIEQRSCAVSYCYAPRDFMAASAGYAPNVRKSSDAPIHIGMATHNAGT